MVRSVAERYAVAAVAFMAAATWLGVGLVHGLLCLLVALVAVHATRIYQRRNDARTRVTSRRRHRTRRPAADRRPQRSGLYDADTEALDWGAGAVGDGAW